MNISGAEFGRLAGVSRAAISKSLKQGKLIKTGSKFDTDHPTNAAYIKYRSMSPSGKSKSVKPVTKAKSPRRKTALELKVKSKSKPAPKKQPPKKKSKPESELKPAIESKQETIHLPEYTETDLSSIDDMNLLPRADLDRLKIIEAIEASRVKKDKDRDNLIPRDLVRHIFSKIYSIDVNEFKNLGMNLAPAIAAITENDSPEVTTKINELIDKELHSILSHIKRIINDFLIKIESKKI